QLPNPPFTLNVDGCFVINGKAYVMLGGSQEVWEYDPNGVPVASSACDTAYFGVSNTNFFGQCTLATDGNIVAVGDADYVYGWTQGDIVLKKYTPDLQLIWSKTFYAGGGMDYASGVFTTSDGGYLIHTAFGNSNAAGMFSAGYIIKTDSSGNQEWVQTLTGQSYGDNYGSKCVENSQGEFVCFGHVQYHPGCNGYATRITKLSSSGAILWSYCLQQNADWNGGFDKMALSDSYLSAWNDLNSGNLVIQKWDDSGSQIGSFNYKFMNQFSTTGGVKRHPSGGFFLYGQYDSTGGPKNAFLAKFDENSVFQWETSFHSGQENSFNNLTIDVNGNILCTGEINETSQPGNLPLVKFSDSGSILASAIFGDSSTNEAALGIVALASGEIVCSGWSDSLGLLVEFCGFDSVATSIVENAEAALPVAIFPNPVNDQLNISFDSPDRSEFSITLFNLIGEKVLEEKRGVANSGKNVHSVSMDHLSVGIYVLRLQIGSHSISKKIIKSL
ncbi:MAG TPA: T9SS type A sorting domain-containing protein, partial [Bacteroidia bacterium]|nr:T9SS type A sorting domain-containing protein [Bacteroidia bacterium]